MHEPVLSFPNEMEAQLPDILILERDLCMIKGGYLWQHLTKLLIVKDDGFQTA